MKTTCIIFALITAGATAFGSTISTNIVNGHVRLEWSYDTNVDQVPLSGNLWFNIYGSTNLTLPVSQWPSITNLNAVDAQGTNGGSTNLYVDLDLVPSSYFFVATASNFWGESAITSNMATVPAPAEVINSTLTIQKLP